MDKNDIPSVGTKVEITLQDIFGKPYTLSGKIAKEPYQHGYNGKCGDWSLYQSHGDVPCFKIEFTPKRKRIPLILQIKDILSIKAV